MSQKIVIYLRFSSLALHVAFLSYSLAAVPATAASSSLGREWNVFNPFVKSTYTHVKSSSICHLETESQPHRRVEDRRHKRESLKVSTQAQLLRLPSIVETSAFSWNNFCFKVGDDMFCARLRPYISHLSTALARSLLRDGKKQEVS
jgi:hypothetical protein